MDFEFILALAILAAAVYLVYLAFVYPVVSIPIVVLFLVWRARKQERDSKPPYRFAMIRRLYIEEDRRKSRLMRSMTSAEWDRLNFEGLPSALPFKEVLRVIDVTSDGKIIGREHKGWIALGGFITSEELRSFELPKHLHDLVPRLCRGTKVYYEGTATFIPPSDPAESSGSLVIRSITKACV